jgi:hypothetical protein
VTRTAAHIILGSKEEPFLPSLLVSLNGVVDTIIVNDNAAGDSPHTATLNASVFARRGALVVDRTPFADFATARNVCLRLHRERDAGEWAMFVDADEVHASAVVRVAKNLAAVSADVDFLDGYTWHFFQSPDLYTAIERRLMFFRVVPGARWEGRVHEQLLGIPGKRLPLPYVYGHYGHILSPRRHAEKGRLYSSLGQPGAVVAQDRLDAIDSSEYFRVVWPRLLRFHGEHPTAVRPLLERLREEQKEQFETAMRLARAYQPWLRRQRNAIEALNYEQRWRSRALNPLARHLLRG